MSRAAFLAIGICLWGASEVCATVVLPYRLRIGTQSWGVRVFLERNRAEHLGMANALRDRVRLARDVDPAVLKTHLDAYQAQYEKELRSHPDIYTQAVEKIVSGLRLNQSLQLDESMIVAIYDLNDPMRPVGILRASSRGPDGFLPSVRQAVRHGQMPANINPLKPRWVWRSIPDYQSEPEAPNTFRLDGEFSHSAHRVRVGEDLELKTFFMESTIVRLLLPPLLRILQMHGGGFFGREHAVERVFIAAYGKMQDSFRPRFVGNVWDVLKSKEGIPDLFLLWDTASNLDTNTSAFVKRLARGPQWLVMEEELLDNPLAIKCSSAVKARAAAGQGKRPSRSISSGVKARTRES